MHIETQRVPMSANDSEATGRDRAKSDWFVIQPAHRGGGAISVDVPFGLAVDLIPEDGDRLRASRVEHDGHRVWTWYAPDDTQVCRLVVRRKTPDTAAIPNSILLTQQVNDPVPSEHVVFAAGSGDYRSKLFHIKSHSTKSEEALITVDEHGARFAPCSGRDSIRTRFMPLQRGTYKLRFTWPRGSDLSHLPAPPQCSDRSWLAADLALSESGDTRQLTMLFDAPDDGREVRFLLVLPGRSTPLPARMELVRLTSAEAVAGARHIVSSSQDVNTAADNALRWMAALADEAGLAAVLPTITEASLQRVLGDDPWLHNYAKNAWEFVQGRTVLTTYPPDICFPIADVCNARCTFCSSWLEGTRVASLDELDSFEEVFRYARWVGLAGHGEPLAHPRIREILSRLSAWLDARSTAYVITNGVYLSELLDQLIESRVRRFNISLNSASPAMHREVMGLPEGSFDEILDAVRAVVARRATHDTNVGMSMVITRQNLPELPAFVALANRIGVDRIQLKTLAPVGGLSEGLNYHLLPPYDHPDYTTLKANALAAIADSGVPVQVDTDSWDVPIFPPDLQKRLQSQPVRVVSREEALRSRELREKWRSLPKYQARTAGRVLTEVDDFDGRNPLEREPPMSCRAPYKYLYINDFSFNMTPCCYLPTVPGAEPIIYAGSGSFMEAWNSEAMVTLRRRLHDGPLFNMCTKCPGTW